MSFVAISLEAQSRSFIPYCRSFEHFVGLESRIIHIIITQYSSRAGSAI